ncbi:unnamed protein product, partial [Prorocentrum cordatum]
ARDSGGQVVSWNARGLCCYKKRRRKNKLRKLERFMKASALITIQETHGVRQQLEVMVASSPYKYNVFHSQVLVPGRVAQLSIKHPELRYQMRVMNVHNYNISPTDKTVINNKWMENLQWASSNHLERTFFAIGDFNIREGVPLSNDHPLPDQ